MAGGQRRYAHYVNIVLDSLFGCLLGSLEQRTHIDIEADVGVTGRNDFGATIVSVLTEFGDHDARLAALLLREFGNQFLRVFECGI